MMGYSKMGDIKFVTICNYCGNHLTEGFVCRRDKSDNSEYELRTESCYCQSNKQLEQENKELKEERIERLRKYHKIKDHNRELRDILKSFGPWRESEPPKEEM